jgi:oxygen-independent coproporphyrinogen III oxidase
MNVQRANTVSAVYLHFPFCRRVCPFCAFAVLRDRPEKHDRYCTLLALEFALLSRLLDIDFRPLRSVYFGGGTPSRLSIDELVQVTDWLRRVIPQTETALWTIEVNPEDMTRTYADALKQIGFSRVSIGAQSFSDVGLETLQRGHRSADIWRAVEALQLAGISDWSLDLMFGYPGQSPADLARDLRQLLRCAPSHVSVYGLQIEEKTAVHRRPEWLRWQQDNEIMLARMFRQVMAQLSAHGFRHYEVSNFARPGWESVHNLLTWNGHHYLGLGLGAHSFLASRRWGNYPRWKAYRLALENGRTPQAFSEIIDRSRRLDEELMVRLRLAEGIDLQALTRCYDLHFSDAWQRKVACLVDNGWLFPEPNRLRLTVEGMILADEITASLAALL